MPRYSATMIDSIVNHLLNFTRPPKAHLVPTPLHPVLESSLRLVQQQLRQKGIELVREFQAGRDLLRADAAQLSQTFVNFYLNAIDAMDGPGRLTVRTENTTLPATELDLWGEPLPRPAIRLSIRDTGAGIRPENVSRIFDPFFTTKSHGTGLGLSVSHGILTEHGTVIDVSSAPGEGTAFLLTFPLLVEDDHA